MWCFFFFVGCDSNGVVVLLKDFFVDGEFDVCVFYKFVVVVEQVEYFFLVFFWDIGAVVGNGNVVFFFCCICCYLNFGDSCIIVFYCIVKQVLYDLF